MRQELLKRKNIRLKEYDYSNEEMYFITICTKNRAKLLGKIIDAEKMEMTEIGELVEKHIKNLEKIYTNIRIYEYIIMPNHIHIIINEKNGLTISRIINQYKGGITKKVGYTVWQKLFYEHIIRNEKEYLQIKEYIQNNIINWNKDNNFV